MRPSDHKPIAASIPAVGRGRIYVISSLAMKIRTSIKGGQIVWGD